MVSLFSTYEFNYPFGLFRLTFVHISLLVYGDLDFTVVARYIKPFLNWRKKLTQIISTSGF